MSLPTVILWLSLIQLREDFQISLLHFLLQFICDFFRGRRLLRLSLLLSWLNICSCFYCKCICNFVYRLWSNYWVFCASHWIMMLFLALVVLLRLQCRIWQFSLEEFSSVKMGANKVEIVFYSNREDVTSNDAFVVDEKKYAHHWREVWVD